MVREEREEKIEKKNFKRRGKERERFFFLIFFLA